MSQSDSWNTLLKVLNSDESTEIFGVHFAPIAVSRERRLQTLALVFWAFIVFLSVPLSIWILHNWLFHSTYLWPLTLIYMSWYFYDLDVCNKGGRR